MEELPEIFDIHQLKEYLESLVMTVTNSTFENFKHIDAKIEAMEKQIATLVVGFGEQAVFLEALLAQLAFATEQEQKAFQDNLSESRKQMLKVMKDGSKDLVAKQDERLASAITDVVDSKSSDS